MVCVFATCRSEEQQSSVSAALGRVRTAPTVLSQMAAAPSASASAGEDGLGAGSQQVAAAERLHASASEGLLQQQPAPQRSTQVAAASSPAATEVVQADTPAASDAVATVGTRARKRNKG